MTGLRARDASQLERLVDEQAALRRVATLVAQGAPAETLLAVVAGQVAEVLRVPLVSIVRFEPDGTATERAGFAPQGTVFRVGTRWSLEGTNVVAQVRESGRPARIDDYAGLTGQIAETTRDAGVRSTVGIPIVVAGRPWGAMVASSAAPEVLPADTEARLVDFTELVATAIANGEARDEVQRLADEQAALRRVATLVASEASESEVFTAISKEIGRLLVTEETRMLRFEDDRSAVVMARWGRFEHVSPVGSRIPLDGKSASALVFQTGQPARFDYGRETGAAARAASAAGVRCVVATPIRVEDRLWGAMVTGTSKEDPLPPETESRLGQFTDLMATAISNTESHARAERLAAEQAALRRVATLVAKEYPPAEVFAKVTDELTSVLGDVVCSLFRDEGDGTATAVAVRGFDLPVGTRLSTDGDGVIATVLRERRPYAIGDYSTVTGAIGEQAREHGVRAAAGSPIVVRGRIWGALGVATNQQRGFPPEIQVRLDQFAELVATVVANADARSEVRRLADEQAAMRRVAMLVAGGSPPTAVFDAVAKEMERLMNADGVTVSRYEPAGEVTVVAYSGRDASKVPPGTRVRHEGKNVTTMVRRSERPARMEHYEEAEGPIAEFVEDLGIRASVGAPIVVDGRLWGVVIATWRGEDAPPPGTEDRMGQFAELLDTAIANADSRDQLTASRARLLTAADEARRRLVRDLHDGAQQRLVHAIVTLKLATLALAEDDGDVESLVAEALDHAQQGNAELRELVHGILPAVLTRGGLQAGVDTVVARADLPVDAEITAERFPAEIEATAYFIVAESLTNVVKHARAERASVHASVRDGTLHIEVRDDGIGGADPGGHGLVGLGDRATALGGRLEIESPVGGGTRVAAMLPLAS